MSFSSSTVTIGQSTKKSDYDRVLANTQYNKTGVTRVESGTVTFQGAKTFQSSTVFNATATFNSEVVFLNTGIETLSSGTTWVVPANITKVKATIIGAGGGGGSGSSTHGTTGGTTTFNLITALGGLGGRSQAAVAAGGAGRAGLCSGNHGLGAYNGTTGGGGAITVQLFTVTPGETIDYTLGVGGAGGTGDYPGGVGGAGQVILEY